jgi:tetratricopeptide (TPR) repeat protein
MENGERLEAEGVLRQCLAARRTVLGDEHPDTLDSMQTLAALLEDQGKLADAEALRSERLEIQRRLVQKKTGEAAAPAVLFAQQAAEPASTPTGASVEQQVKPETESTAAATPLGEEKVLAYEGFDGELTLDWQILHPDPSHYSLTKLPGALTITTQDGGFYMSNTDYENLFLIDNPADANQDFQLTTCLSQFRPEANWNQAGLVCYNGDNDNLKFVHEWEHGSGGRIFTAIAEGKGAWTLKFRAHREFEKVWLRITKRGNRYAFSTSLDGETFLPLRFPRQDTTGGFKGGVPWGDGAVERVGIVAKNGPTKGAPEVDASFDFFEVRSFPRKPEPGEEPAHVIASLIEDDAETLDSTDKRALAMEEAGKLEEAEALRKKILDVRQLVYGEENADTLGAMNRLAVVLRKRGKLDGVEALNRRNVEIRQRVQGKEHPDTLWAMSNLANVLEEREKLDEAEAVRKEALGIAHAQGRKEEPDELASMTNAANLRKMTGQLDMAEAILRQILDLRRRVSGEGNPGTLMAMKDVAITVYKRGKFDEAESILREAIATGRQALGDENLVVPQLMNYLVHMLEQRGRLEEAGALLEESLRLQRRVLGKKPSGAKEATAPSPGSIPAPPRKGLEREEHEEDAASTKFVIPPENLQIAEEAKECAANLAKIYAAIREYKRDKGRLPGWLSDLVPDYLSKDLLLCRNDPRHTAAWYPDPVLPCSYSYEFSLARIPSGWDPTQSMTSHDWKTQQVKLFGDVVPIVRCRHHDDMILGISVGGQIYRSPNNWEFVFIPYYRFNDELPRQQSVLVQAGRHEDEAQSRKGLQASERASEKEHAGTRPTSEPTPVRTTSPSTSAPSDEKPMVHPETEKGAAAQGGSGSGMLAYDDFDGVLTWIIHKK